MKVLAVIGVIIALTGNTYAWSVENLGNPPNSSNWEYRCSIDNDGDKIFFNRDDGKIYLSHKTGNWSNPTALPAPINNPGASHPFWDANNNDLYFVGGSSSADIFYCHWNGSSWESTKHSVGSAINSGDNEYASCLSPDGRYFYFTRGNGGDIYVANWNPATHTGSNVRSAGIGRGYSCSYRNGCLYFSSTYNYGGGRGDNDCWKASGSGANFNTPENLPFNTGSSDSSPSIDGCGRIFFASTRNGGHGAVDLYVYDPETAVEETSIGRIKALYH